MLREQNLRRHSLSRPQRAHLLTLPKKVDVKVPGNPIDLERLFKA